MPESPEPVFVRDQLKLLLLDTCGSEASVALAEGSRVLTQMLLPGRRASEELLTAIADRLRGCGWRIGEVDALVIVRGPGSFTGVRVGLSAAKALAEGAGLRLLAVSRLEVLAQKADTGSLVTLDAGRGEVFWAQVLADGIGEQSIAPMTWVMERARTLDVSVLRELSDAPKPDWVDVQEVPALTAADALPLATQQLLLGQSNDPALLDALYLHKTEQETLARQRRQRITNAMEGSQP